MPRLRNQEKHARRSCRKKENKDNQISREGTAYCQKRGIEMRLKSSCTWKKNKLTLKKEVKKKKVRLKIVI